MPDALDGYWPDEPEPMDNPCPGGYSRDDSPTSAEKTTTVSLPDGCENAGPHNSIPQFVNPDDDYHSTTLTDWGKFTAWPSTYDVDFKYDDCRWVCEISNVQAKTRIQVSASNYPGFSSITQASDVPCDPPTEPLLAKSDLNDSDLTDDVGAPLTKYWIHSAIVAHEEKHRTDWQEYYGVSLSTAILVADGITEEIDCDLPRTITCQSVNNYWMTGEYGILFLFNWAWDSAREKFDDPTTPVDEAEMRAYREEATIEGPIVDALQGGECSP